MPEFANLIRIVADDVTQLRKCDVFRLLDTYSDVADHFGEWVVANRPDLADEVSECLADIKGES